MKYFTVLGPTFQLSTTFDRKQNPPTMYDDEDSSSSSKSWRLPPEPSIPWWQRKERPAQAVPNSNSDQVHANDLSQPQPPSDRVSLIGEASKSLEEDDDIKDAPMKMKITFLESKGLDRKEIADLLSLDPDTYASNEPLQTKAAGVSQVNFGVFNRRSKILLMFSH